LGFVGLREELPDRQEAGRQGVERASLAPKLGKNRAGNEALLLSWAWMILKRPPPVAVVLGQHQIGGYDGFDLAGNPFQVDGRNYGIQLFVAKPGVDAVADARGTGHRALG
jgi:hypothetical protein